MRPNPHIALIYHYDLARALNGEPVDWVAIPVNVDAGREGGDLCRAAADFAKRRDLFAMPAPSHDNGESCGSTTSTATSIPIPTVDAPTSITDAAPTTPASAITTTSSPRQSVTPSATTSSDSAPATSAPPTTSTTSTPTSSNNSAANRDRLRARIADLIDQGHEQAIRRHWPADVAPLSKPGHTDDELALILAAVRRVETEVGAPWHPDDGPPPHSRIAIERALKAWEGRDPGTAWFAASLIATFEQCRNADSTFEELVAQFSISQADRLYDAAASQ